MADSHHELRQLLESMSTDTLSRLPSEMHELRELLLTTTIHVAPCGSSQDAQNKLDVTLKKQHRTTGVMVTLHNTQVESKDNIGPGKDNRGVVASLSLKRNPHAGDYNNLGCAHMWLFNMTAAKAALIAAVHAQA